MSALRSERVAWSREEILEAEVQALRVEVARLRHHLGESSPRTAARPGGVLGRAAWPFPPPRDVRQERQERP